MSEVPLLWEGTWTPWGRAQRYPESISGTAFPRGAPRITCPRVSISEQLLRRKVKWFRGGLVCKALRLLYHSTLGSRVIKKKKKNAERRGPAQSYSIMQTAHTTGFAVPIECLLLLIQILS